MANDDVCYVAVGGVVVALEPVEELREVLGAIDQAARLLTLLDNVPAEQATYMKTAKEKMRWTVKRLSLRAWALSAQIEPTTD